MLVHEGVQLRVLLRHVRVDVALAGGHPRPHGRPEEPALARAEAELEVRGALVLLHLLAPERDGLEPGDGGRERRGLVQPDGLLHVPGELLREVEEPRLLLAEERLQLLLVASGELLDVVELPAHDGPVPEVVPTIHLDAVADADADVAT